MKTANQKRFEKTFAGLKKKNEAAFVPFVVLGDPDYKASFEIIEALVRGGADALELGFAFSDPVAAGPTIQAADVRALSKGANTAKNFELIRKIRALHPGLPISLLVYSNLAYNDPEKFYSASAAAGVDAVLAADCPPEEALPLVRAARQHGISPVFIVSPTTSNQRLPGVLKNCSAYVYLVSLTGITGARSSLSSAVVPLIRRVRSKIRLPILVGFGISKPAHVSQVVSAGADGAIVGSAIEKIVESNLNNRKKMLVQLENYCRAMKNATRKG